MNELGIAKVSTEAGLNICSLTIHRFSVRMILFYWGLDALSEGQNI